MKKLIILFCLLFLTSYSFANVEICLNFYGVPVSSTNFKYKDYASQNVIHNPNFGMEHDISFFYGERASKFDAGLGIFWFSEFFSKMDTSVADLSGSGFTLGIGIGPAFRITFTDNFSLFMRPGIAIRGRDFSVNSELKQNYFDFAFLFDANVGGRYWFLNVTGFHLGLDFGLGMNAGPGFGYYSYAYKEYYSYPNYVTMTDIKTFDETVYSFKIYLGLCFNFGDRGIDRFNSN